MDVRSLKVTMDGRKLKDEDERIPSRLINTPKRQPTCRYSLIKFIKAVRVCICHHPWKDVMRKSAQQRHWRWFLDFPDCVCTPSMWLKYNYGEPEGTGLIVECRVNRMVSLICSNIYDIAGIFGR